MNLGCTLQVYELDLENNIISEHEPVHNTLVKDGRDQIGKWLTYVTTDAASGFIFLGVGASSTPSIDPASDDRLGGTAAAPSTAHEYIQNATRKQMVSDSTTGVWLSSSDWVQDDTTIDGVRYIRKCIMECLFDESDGNNGVPSNPFRRYALFNTPTLPGTVTGKSGLMLNEIIDTADTNKHSGNRVRVVITLRV